MFSEIVFCFASQGYSTASLGLSFEGKDLNGDSTLLSEFGIQHMSVIHITSISKISLQQGTFSFEGGKDKRERMKRFSNF